MSHVLIIGGSDAGISAALRIRELSPETEVSVMLEDDYPNFSICGLPFFLSGETPDWRSLAHRTKSDLEKEGIRLLTNRRATVVDAGAGSVTTAEAGGADRRIAYDALVLCTGAASRRPPIEGLDLPGVHFLRWMGDSSEMESRVTDHNPRSAVIVGGGYIGLEMADALTRRGLKVTLVEYAPTVLTTVHEGFGRRIGEELTRHGVIVHTGVAVERVERPGTACVSRAHPTSRLLAI